METHIILSSLRRAVQSAMAHDFDPLSLTLWTHGRHDDIPVGYVEIDGLMVEIRPSPLIPPGRAMLGEPLDEDDWWDIPVRTR